MTNIITKGYRIVGDTARALYEKVRDLNSRKTKLGKGSLETRVFSPQDTPTIYVPESEATPYEPVAKHEMDFVGTHNEKHYQFISGTTYQSIGKIIPEETGRIPDTNNRKIHILEFKREKLKELLRKLPPGEYSAFFKPLSDEAKAQNHLNEEGFYEEVSKISYAGDKKLIDELLEEIRREKDRPKIIFPNGTALIF